MRLLKRNLTTVEYHAYLRKEEILNDGKHTGRPNVVYADPVFFEGNLSAPSAYATHQLFGIDTNYTHVLLIEGNDTGIEEEGLIVHNDNVYEIRSVRPSLNVTAIALLKRTKNKV